MPRQSYTGIFAYATEAEWRTSMKLLSDALKACLTQTADTGQMDWTRTSTFTDAFTRADGAVANGWLMLGTTPTANVESNQFRLAGATNGAVALRDAGSPFGGANIRVKMTSVATGNPQICWRWNAAGTQGVSWDPVAGAIRAWTTVGSNTTIVSHTAFTPLATDVLEVMWQNNLDVSNTSHTFICKRNGTVVASGTYAVGTNHNAASYCGVRTSANATGALFDDFEMDPYTRPAQINTTGAYEIYRFSDALQATQPVFLKVEYGYAGASTGTPSVRVSVGTSTNGSGTLTGLTGTPSFPNRTVPSGATGTTYACYKDGTFNLAWNVNTGSTQSHLVFGVSRTKDANGDSTGNGLLCHHSAVNNGTQPGVSWWSFDLNYTTPLLTQAAVPCLMPSGASSGTDPLVNLYNWFILVPDLYNCTGWFSYKTGEITPMSEVDVAIVGSTSRHYLCLGVQQEGSFSSNSISNMDALAMLWEV